ncbi:hypothetical protein ACZ90_01645 [Streptomyces albus subsp. albus]|nr:hypothetical protein ACZ90_01645 [Streptomyces albus subsp. albus]
MEASGEDRRGTRGLRAALFATLCVSLSATLHALLTPMPVPLTTVAAFSVAVFAIAYALADREPGYRRIAGLLLPLELIADTFFSLGQQACYGQAGGAGSGTLGLLGQEVLCRRGSVGDPLSSVPGIDPATGGLAVSPWLLLAAHLLTGLLAAAWLHRGEAALVRLLGAVAEFTFRSLLTGLACALALLGAAPAAGPAVPAPGPAEAPPRGLTLLRHCTVRRGPPRVLAV